MKKLFFLAFLFFTIILSVKAQNVQLHYDFGEGRKLFTTTVEMFKPDKYGSTFFFIDMDYSSNPRGIENGVSLAYWEIARSFKFNESHKFEPRIEYNGGTGRMADFSYAINNAWLAGGQYTINSEDYSKVITVQANYKYIQGKHDASFQLTAVWGLHFLARKLSFTGFADFWREENLVFDSEGNPSETKYVFLTEPQIWYNFHKNFSVGSEIEISTNFAANKGFMVNPTLAVKWIFN